MNVFFKNLKLVIILDICKKKYGLYSLPGNLY